MTSPGEGTTSVVPATTSGENTTTLAHFDQLEAEALDALSHVQDPEEAEELLRKVSSVAEAARLAQLGEEREQRWRALRLKAERRVGELLPDPKPPNDRGQGRKKQQQPVTDSSKSDGMAQSRARKVAEVPQEEFDEYVDNNPKPTREGLLRDHQKPKPKRDTRPRKQRKKNEPTISGKSGISHDPAVIEWVRARIREGWTRDEIARASRDKTDGWPHPDKHLTNGGVSECRAVIAAMEQNEHESPPRQKKKEPKDSGKRLRELHGEKRNGRTGDLFTLQLRISEYVSILESFDLSDLNWTEETDDQISRLFDDLAMMEKWNNLALSATSVHMSELSNRSKIKKLQERIDDPGSPNERANAIRLLAILEKKRNAARLEQKIS